MESSYSVLLFCIFSVHFIFFLALWVGDVGCLGLRIEERSGAKDKTAGGGNGIFGIGWEGDIGCLYYLIF